MKLLSFAVVFVSSVTNTYCEAFQSSNPRSAHWQQLPCQVLPPDSYNNREQQHTRLFSSMANTEVGVPPSWQDLERQVGETAVGIALNKEVELRQQGRGSAHVQNTLRKFNSDTEPHITLYRDHAGWCPYCQKTMLLIEEKEIPIKIELVPMRSYGDKPREFMNKVPGGLLPAIEVNGQVITESQVIMELLDEWHSKGYKQMLPSDTSGKELYGRLARLERELFSWWCTLLFRPEGGFGGNAVKNLLGGKNTEVSASMRGFLDCMKQVDKYLTSTKGPWFFGDFDHPTMIDFIYVSHVERMLASCCYWKGLDLRDPKWNLKGLNRWLEAFEKRECYLAFKSDYYTHVMDIPPQYGPGYTGGFIDDQVKFSQSISGRNGSWSLPLPHDDPLQPLYNGPPLPICVLEAAKLHPDSDGSYLKCDEDLMSKACRHMAAWKLSGNGPNVARFASRGGPSGANNMRKTFGAELADPYADPDSDIQPVVDQVLRLVCRALLADSSPDKENEADLKQLVAPKQTKAVVSCLAYLRNRVGVPRDLPLAAGRYLRAYLNWAIETLGG